MLSKTKFSVKSLIFIGVIALSLISQLCYAGIFGKPLQIAHDKDLSHASSAINPDDLTLEIQVAPIAGSLLTASASSGINTSIPDRLVREGDASLEEQPGKAWWFYRKALETKWTGYRFILDHLEENVTDE